MSKTVYQVLVGEQKTINGQLTGGETKRKPILMSAVPNPNTPNGVLIVVLVEQTID
jgi:hypothetical protein